MMERVTKRELEIYQKIKDMKTEDEDKQEFMKIIGDKAVRELLEQSLLVKNR
ncbi:hypothetical protein P7H62_03710 [Vagococcus carniphilus]|uniref:hypothetical protein n=1 Tax=Vagococcus carniphilus TaxID=218144 RepID=UPI0028911C0C|nr:hypothetical protein [Vagococcus carniphilus]MDT2830276.1 hypothetical protein [Vagococcus carniphilus]MDT2838708.1 hypothetical protein [Vagococcus carniphilus]MDT2853546.1 hypothetical protein [Vagococcus carniphilus]